MNVTALAQAPKDYIELLDRVHRHLRPRTYVEIGVQTGKSLALSLPSARAVGVDPEPQVIYRLPRSTKVVALTSDDFFGRHNPNEFFAGTPLDLAFIDGMHLFEFALRDFINLEKWSASESVILAHDCYPIDEASAARVRTTRNWTGDVWKIVLCLKEFRPDLEISTVKAPPSGLCLITGLDPDSRVLESHYTEICERFISLDYRAVAERRDESLNAVENDWPTVSSLLPAPRQAGNGDNLRPFESPRLLRRTVIRRKMQRFLG